MHKCMHRPFEEEGDGRVGGSGAVVGVVVED